MSYFVAQSSCKNDVLWEQSFRQPKIATLCCICFVWSTLGTLNKSAFVFCFDNQPLLLITRPDWLSPCQHSVWLITDQADAENPSILHPAREEVTAASYSTSTSIWMVVQTSVLAPASMANAYRLLDNYFKQMCVGGFDTLYGWPWKTEAVITVWLSLDGTAHIVRFKRVGAVWCVIIKSWCTACTVCVGVSTADYHEIKCY